MGKRDRNRGRMEGGGKRVRGEGGRKGESGRRDRGRRKRKRRREARRECQQVPAPRC